MADIKGTHSPEQPTRQDFPEVKGKIVDKVELVAEAHYYAVAIRFQDNTALAFNIEPCVVAFPDYSDWAGGSEKLLKQYQPVRSRVSRL